MAMRLRDVLGPAFADAYFEELFPARRRPVVVAGPPALVSVEWPRRTHFSITSGAKANMPTPTPELSITPE